MWLIDDETSKIWHMSASNLEIQSSFRWIVHESVSEYCCADVEIDEIEN